MDRLYALDHAPIDFYFKQSVRDFVVEEIPLYEFSGEGEHLVLHVRKKEMTTWDMIGAIAAFLGIKTKEIGYAGLKDKNAMTKQYISLHKQHEAKLEGFTHEKIKILEKHYHNNKIRIGHLKGNRFFIRLKKVTPVAAQKIDQALAHIKTQGMPNFFGFQRFGINGENSQKGEAISEGRLKERNVKLRKMYLSAYQSHLFNLWLSRRIEISRMVESFTPKEIENVLNMPLHVIENMKAQTHFLKLMPGDMMMHYPYGRVFGFDGSAEEAERFSARDAVPTGALCGKRLKNAEDWAHEIEKEFLRPLNEDGVRRYAWVFPENIEAEYREAEAWYELHFTLPKGSYATVLIEELAKRNIKGE